MTQPEPPFSLALIWAQAHGRVIGAHGTMPWRLPEDLARFKELTWGHTVLMGRATWESLPPGFRPLPGRRCLVLSRSLGLRLEGAEVVASIADALALAAASCAAPSPAHRDFARRHPDDARLDHTVWVIGGARIYEQTIELAGRLAVTQIDLDVAGDTYAPAIGPEWTLTQQSEWRTSRTGLRYRFEDYRRAS